MLLDRRCLATGGGGGQEKLHEGVFIPGNNAYVQETFDVLEPPRKAIPGDINPYKYPDINQYESIAQLEGGDLALKAQTQLSDAWSIASAKGSNKAIKVIKRVAWTRVPACHRFRAMLRPDLVGRCEIRVKKGDLVGASTSSVARIHESTSETVLDWEDCDGTSYRIRRRITLKLEVICERNEPNKPIQATATGTLHEKSFYSVNGQEFPGGFEAEIDLKDSKLLGNQGVYARQARDTEFLGMAWGPTKFDAIARLSIDSSGQVSVVNTGSASSLAKSALSIMVGPFWLRDIEDNVSP